MIFAGTSVGVSHLVQSARAGTDWGLALWVFILLALVLKYPPFRFGPVWSAATGKSLLEGYRRLGPWTLWLFAVLTVLTMFAVQAAVTIVTSALLHGQLERLGMPSPGIPWLNGLLLASCAGMLLYGGYVWLDRLTKILVPFFTLLTVVATAVVLPRVWSDPGPLLPSMMTLEQVSTIAFIAALIGWMPTAVDISAWQSLWVLARGRSQNQRLSVGEVVFDFNVGYVATGVLAFCFLILGAAMASTGAEFPATATAYPGFFIDLYATTIGPWAGWVVSAAALAVMVSTTVAVLDGFPRVLSVLVQRFTSPETEDGFSVAPEGGERSTWYVRGMVLLAGGALVLLQVLSNAFLLVVDVATVASFLTAPVLALLNHRVVTSAAMPEAHRLSPAMRWYSLLSVLCLSAFAVFYVALRIYSWVA